MGFARWVFRLAGVYGLIVLAPQYFLEEQIGVDQPPPINHPEHFYGFVGVALAWQVAFLIIGSDPIRYRPLMLAAIIEKATFAGATAALYFQQRIPANVLAFGLIDGTLGVLFTIAYLRLRTRPQPDR